MDFYFLFQNKTQDVKHFLFLLPLAFHIRISHSYELWAWSFEFFVP